MVKVIEGEEVERSPFTKLKVLNLIQLPKLEAFCDSRCSLELPSDGKITNFFRFNQESPNLKSLVSSTENDFKRCSGAINHDSDDSLHLFCKSHEAAFGRLEELKVDGCENISSLWCDHIPIDFFTGLVYLTVSNCVNIKSLFSPSIAGNLDNLKELTIERCIEMVKVIEGEEVERSPFIKLQVLNLTQLPKLKAFSDWKCDIQLPSLRDLGILNCPEMERLSFGRLTAPNLDGIRKKDLGIIDYTNDLNDELFLGSRFLSP